MHLPESFSFHCPLKINCGHRALDQLPADLAAVNANTPMILASRDQIGNRHLRHVINAFKTSGLTLGVYDRVPNRPDPDLLSALARMYHERGCDSLIAVGSHYVPDVAKRLNLRISGASSDALGRSDAAAVDPGPLPPLVLVATIGGNGDEASGYVNDGGRRLFSPRLTPAIACIDPSMMDTYNHQDMVDGALVALAHAVEAFLDLPAGPMCHAYAHSAIGLIANRLPLALRQTDAKLNCCAVVNGQVAAGCAFSTAPAGICHALAVALKESTDLPLGYLLALLLPHLVAQVGDQQSERAGELLYPLVGADTYALTASDYKIPRIMALFWDFFDALGDELDRRIPLSFSQAGLTDEQISRAQSTVSGAHAADAVARIVRGARLGADLL